MDLTGSSDEHTSTTATKSCFLIKITSILLSQAMKKGMAINAYERFPLPRSAEELYSPFDNIISKVQFISAQYPSLYTREWQKIKGTPCPNRIRVMQFNMLAEGLSAHPAKTPHFDTAPEGESVTPSDCGGFDTGPDASTVFDFEGFRRWRLLEEIIRVDPDVLALEECDRYHDFFQPALSSLGYQVQCVVYSILCGP